MGRTGGTDHSPNESPPDIIPPQEESDGVAGGATPPKVAANGAVPEEASTGAAARVEAGAWEGRMVAPAPEAGTANPEGPGRSK